MEVKRNFFTFVNSINDQNYDPPTESDKKIYEQFQINKAFSFYPDTILFADHLNVQGYTNKMHYDFLFNVLEKKRRRSPWFKPEKEEFLDLIANYYQVSYSKAREYLNLLTTEEIKDIQEKTDQGG